MSDTAVVVSSGTPVPPDGPGPNHTIDYRGRSVRPTATPYRVMAFMWFRDWVGFDELAAHVNQKNPHANPTDSGFKNWVHRGNERLEPLGLPRRLRADTVNRRIYWEEGPVVTPPAYGFTL